MSESSYRILGSLIGLRLREIGRAADLLWMSFGEFRKVPTKNGGTRQVGQWAIHVQIAWRFVRNSKILVGITDMHYDAKDGSNYDWDTGGESRFDRLAGRLNQELEADMDFVTDVECDDFGGFKLCLKSGLTFDVLPCISHDFPDVEYYRIFEPATDNPHYVVETINRRTKRST